MALGTLNIQITLDNMQFTAALNQSGIQLSQFAGSLRTGTKSVTAMQSAMSSFGDRLRNTVVTLGLARNAVHNLWSVTGSWNKAMVESASGFEKMGVLLTTLSTKNTFGEKMEDGKKQFQQITELARTTPFTIGTIQDAWVKFKSAGLDPANGSLKSLLDATAAFGGSDDALHRAAIAIQQMAGKGVISMEELRQQLGEAIPTAIQNMADSMGMSLPRLMKLIASGSVEAKDALRRLFGEFNNVYGGRSAEMMKTFSGQLAAFMTKLSLFGSDVAGESGLFQAVKDFLAFLSKGLADPQVKAMVVDLTHGVAKLVDGFQTLIKWVWENRTALKTLGLVIGSVLLYLNTFNPLVLLVATSGGKLVTVLKELPIWIGILANIYKTSGFTVAWKNAGALMGGFFALSPAGWIALTVAALVAVGAAILAFSSKTGAATDELERFYRTADKGQIDGARQDIQRWGLEIQNLQMALYRVKGNKGGESQAAYLQTQIDGVTANISRAQGLIDKAQIAAADQIIQTRNELFQRDLADQAKKFHDQAGFERTKLEEGLKEQVSLKTKTAEEASQAVTAGRKVILEKETKELLALYEHNLTRQLNAVKKLGLTAETAANVTLLGDLLNATRARLDQFNKDLKDGPNLLNTKDKLPIDNFIDNMKEKIASLEAQLRGGKAALEQVAAFEQKLKDDMKDGVQLLDGKPTTPAQVKEARAKVLRMAELTNEVQAHNEALKQQEYALNKIQQSVDEMTPTYEAWMTALNEGGFHEQTTEIKSFNAEIDKLRKKITSPEDIKKLADLQAEGLAKLSSQAGVKQLVDLQAETKKVNAEMITDTQKRYQYERDQAQMTLDAYISQNNIGNEKGQVDELRAAFDDLWASKRRALTMDEPLNKLAESWKDTTKSMKEATAGWVSDGVDAFVEFASSGKINFASMAKSILADILKIIIRGMIANAILSSFGLTNASSAMRNPGIGQGIGGGLPTNLAANGDVMTQFGPMELQKYSKGGIARRPQVSIFGEGSKPEAYVPLPDGRSIPVTMSSKGSQAASTAVTVNVINQSGHQVDAQQQGQPRFDGGSMVLDVVLKAVGQPGAFRDGMRQAVR